MDIKAIVTDAVEGCFRKFGFVPASGAGDSRDAEPHPVLAAALAAGIDTPEKFAALQEDAKTGKHALTEKRDYAKKAAVAFFGNDTEAQKAALARAERSIDAIDDVQTLSSMADTWLDASPGADHAGERQTQSARHGKTAADPQDEDGAQGAGFGASHDGLNPRAIYARRREQRGHK